MWRPITVFARTETGASDKSDESSPLSRPLLSKHIRWYCPICQTACTHKDESNENIRKAKKIPFCVRHVLCVMKNSKAAPNRSAVKELVKMRFSCADLSHLSVQRCNTRGNAMLQIPSYAMGPRGKTSSSSVSPRRWCATRCWRPFSGYTSGARSTSTARDTATTTRPTHRHQNHRVAATMGEVAGVGLCLW